MNVEEGPYVEPDVYAGSCLELAHHSAERYAPELRALLGAPAIRYALGQLLVEAQEKKEQLVGADLTQEAGRMQAIVVQQHILGLRRAFDSILEIVNGG